MTENLGIVTDESYFGHDTGPGHPESSARLEAVGDALKPLEGIWRGLDAREASEDELALVHDLGYIEKIINLRPAGRIMLDPDTVFSPGTKTASLRAAGGVLEAVDRVLIGEIKRAFCAVRPPGHHAECDRAMGFCIFNNIAVGAAHALKKHGLKRVAIVDWDLHHGNGTQSAFYDSDSVLYISLHQYPHYPGSGSPEETGVGGGEGYTINIPMRYGAGDGEYDSVFGAKVMPSIEKYRPELLMISAGFDAHRDDPLGSINLSTDFFGEMTSRLRELADKYCGGRIVSVLEGGYDPVALGDSVMIHVKELAR